MMSTVPQLPENVATTEAWEPFVELPCLLTVEVSVPRFRVRDLLALEARGVVDSGWSHGMEIPVRLNGNVAMTANFEVIGNRLALRVVEVI
jgi:hypothetical protein